MAARLAQPVARKAAAPRPAAAGAGGKAWTGFDGAGGGIAQAKLEVGPSHDRFEAEADRIAASVVANRGAPSAPPAISPFDGGGAARKRAQREERRPIGERERSGDAQPQDFAKLLQRKTEAADAIVEEDKVAQTKPAEAGTAPAKPEEEKSGGWTAQAKMAGVLQRDDVDDDTVLETTIQAKRDASVQRAEVEGKSDLEQESKEEKPSPPAPAQRKRSAQRDPASGGGFTAPAAVESGIAALRGGGEPLPGNVRAEMEPHFGSDLSGVRIHSGARAGDLSRQVNAHAFTIGQDVFFGHGQYDPATDSGRMLLAHELTHTVQQQGGSSHAQPSRIQRAGRANAGGGSKPKPEGEAADPGLFPHKKGKLRVADGKKTITMASLPVPKINKEWKGAGTGAKAGDKKPPIPASGTGPWAYLGKSRRGNTARQQWLQQIGKKSAKVKTAIADKDKGNLDSKSQVVREDGEKVTYLKSTNPKGQGLNFLLIGTPTELSETAEILLPIWNRKGESTLFDVDHIHELQLGGLDDYANFWLLDQGSNRSSGSRIAQEMRKDFDEVVEAAKGDGYFVEGRGGSILPNWDTLRDEKGNQKSTWRIEYEELREIDIKGSGAFWHRDEIEAGAHLEELVALKPKEIMARGLIYKVNPKRVEATIFALKTGRGGFFREVDYSNPDNVVTTDGLAGGNQFYKGFAVPPQGFKMVKAPPREGSKKARAVLGSEPLKPNDVIAEIRGVPFPASKKVKAKELLPIPIKWAPEFGFGGYADVGWINEKLARLELDGASPVEIRESGLTPQGELFANGEIIATKKLFPDLRIPIYLRGNEIRISFPIPTDSLKFGPVKVTDAALDVGFGEQGLFLEGWADVKVASVGSGRIQASSKSRTIRGDFNFDMKFLKKSSATLTYNLDNDKLDLVLQTTLNKGALPGVASGEVTGHFSRDAIGLEGSFKLAPPLQDSSIALGYTEKDGLKIAADNIPLPVAKIPGIQEATLSARGAYNPDDGSWRLAGEGKARFSIPPATGELSVAVDGRRITIAGNAGFSLGVVSGSLGVTATNAKLDEQGQPIPDQVADKFNVTGKGSASLKFGILTGTVGIELTPDQRLLVVGEVAAPPSLPVFGKRSQKRQLFHVRSPDLLIWGIKIAGYGIGISAFADARLTADYFVGPGTLENTKIKVKLDLQKPEEAVVDGNASFVVPAGAGLTLDIGGGLTATLAVAYVEGRVGVDARLGISAEARADMLLHWTRAEGLSLAATARVSARPQFDIGVNASVKAGLDLPWPLDIEKKWGPWRKSLGSFGPSLALGATIPIAWSERKGLDFNPDKIEITRPEIDGFAVMKDCFLKLV